MDVEWPTRNDYKPLQKMIKPIQFLDVNRSWLSISFSGTKTQKLGCFWAWGKEIIQLILPKYCSITKYKLVLTQSIFHSGYDHPTINTALGTSPSSFNVDPKSSMLKTLFGKFCVKLWTSIPESLPSADATSKRVVCTGNDFWTLPPDVWSRSRLSV